MPGDPDLRRADLRRDQDVAREDSAGLVRSTL
jgi:hypothetical protein